MSNDLLKRLRDHSYHPDGSLKTIKVLQDEREEAANYIEMLQVKVQSLETRYEHIRSIANKIANIATESVEATDRFFKGGKL